MASKEEIIRSINGKVKGEYPKWQIGVTDKPPQRKSTHDPSQWDVFNPSTEKVAREIEKHFIDKGMKGGPGGPGNANYLYIFKK